MPVRNWAGLVLAAIGVWFLAAAWRRRHRALTVQRAARTSGLKLDVYAPRTFALTTAIARPIVTLVLLAAGGEVLQVYRVTDGAPLLSAVDLAGFLLLLLGCGVWFSVSTRYRAVVPVIAPGGPR